MYIPLADFKDFNSFWVDQFRDYIVLSMAISTLSGDQS